MEEQSAFSESRLEDIVTLRVCKDGNDLLLILPDSFVRSAGLTAGDTIDAAISATGAITLTPKPIFDNAAFRRVRRSRAAMPMTPSSVERSRSNGRGD